MLPAGWDHERLGLEIILGEEMRAIWGALKPPLEAEDIVKLAIGAKKYKKYRGGELLDWENVLSQIIVGDAFGVDRMDYLLRDSWHTGVAYGNFDRYRLIDTLRILPRSDRDESKEPVLGLEQGGIHSAEAMILARYFMYQQVYFHPVRRIYDIHLKNFLKLWLADGCFQTDIDKHLEITDIEVMDGIRKAARNEGHPAHGPAARIVNRGHFRRLYEENLSNSKEAPSSLDGPGQMIYQAAREKYGEEKVIYDSYDKIGESNDFPVQKNDGRIVSSLRLSGILERVPPFAFEFIFVHPGIYEDAQKWRRKNQDSILANHGGK